VRAGGNREAEADKAEVVGMMEDEWECECGRGCAGEVCEWWWWW
jgi:hypothetical protein